MTLDKLRIFIFLGRVRVIRIIKEFEFEGITSDFFNLMIVSDQITKLFFHLNSSLFVNDIIHIPVITCFLRLHVKIFQLF